MARNRRTGKSLIASTIEAQAAMWITLGVRVPQLLTGTMTAAERHRMVAEKAAAMAEGVQAASMAGARLARHPRRLGTPTGLVGGLTTMTMAVVQSFQSRVKANARRLTKARKNSG